MKIDITSFSYKSGPPAQFTSWADETHGGGYIFDCRAIPNPGREPQFKKLSGLDEPVKQYLASLPESEKFFQNSSQLVLESIRAYLARNFSYLSVAYGCTGGQHRSVYFSEKLAELLKKEFGNKLEVNVLHREEKVWPK